MIAPTPAALIDFEKTHWTHNGAKEEAIRRTFGLSAPRYYMLLGRAVADMEGIRHDALWAARIRRRFEARRAA